jgi:predicted RecA/RadA family phage recombinase
MKNFIQDGRVVTLTAPAGGVKSGDGLIVGSVFGVCAYDADEADAVEVALTGVFELPKTAPAIAEGAAVSWDSAAHNVLAPAAGKFPIGVCVAAAGLDEPTCRVRLNGIATAAA